MPNLSGQLSPYSFTATCGEPGHQEVLCSGRTFAVANHKSRLSTPPYTAAALPADMHEGQALHRVTRGEEGFSARITSGVTDCRDSRPVFSYRSPQAEVMCALRLARFGRPLSFILSLIKSEILNTLDPDARM
jgi:hypothetical protein